MSDTFRVCIPMVFAASSIYGTECFLAICPISCTGCSIPRLFGIWHIDIRRVLLSIIASRPFRSVIPGIVTGANLTSMPLVFFSHRNGAAFAIKLRPSTITLSPAFSSRPCATRLIACEPLAVKHISSGADPIICAQAALADATLSSVRLCPLALVEPKVVEIQ